MEGAHPGGVLIPCCCLDGGQLDLNPTPNRAHHAFPTAHLSRPQRLEFCWPFRGEFSLLFVWTK